MIPAHIVEIVTPKNVRLNGLWIGAKKTDRAVVWVHGLGSSMFSKLRIAELLSDDKTAVLMFNNRGHDKVASLSTTTAKRMRGGSVHEIFTDSDDDIQGAVNFARGRGARRIFVAGHSTGCQKSVYFASKKPRGVNGIIILAPMSDYSAERAAQGAARMKRAEKVARDLVRRGEKHAQLPEDVWGWPWIADAQRFISLYTGKGPEEIFTYWDAAVLPRTLRSVKLPLLVLLAQKDEFQDRPAEKIADWFAEHVKVGDRIVVVPRVTHGFEGGERQVVREIRSFINAGGK